MTAEGSKKGGINRAAMHGIQTPNAKLTPEKVHQIRALLEKGYGCTVIAEMVGISRQTISAIKHGRAWQHV
jgi:DNA-binding XRE family transcriptional regulator